MGYGKKTPNPTYTLVKAGFQVLRFWNHEVLRELEAVKQKIWLELQVNDQTHPHPDPLHTGHKSLKERE
ncbi:MAG: DUF559 domain-containing protein [Nitrospirae bacterium]|nr:DUF559 domain-containing protein [Nitrospirota bacterium]